MSEIKVPVKLKNNSYEIIIGKGVLSQLGQHVKKLFPNSRAAIIADENVFQLHKKTLCESLTQANIKYETFIMQQGEKTKSWHNLQTLVEDILAHSFERGDIVIAFGGGVIGDLAGFVAGITLRGLKFIQIPTSLLAQVDSAVGGKTGINSTHGKNLIGLFHQPSLVLSDVALLKTMQPRELRAGYGEIVKYALIYDEEFFIWLEKNWQAIFNFEEPLIEAIEKSCQIKAKVVENDEREQGTRALLNLGHTFAHALEAGVAYDSHKLMHGEAVAIGLVLAHKFSAKLGFCDESHASRIIKHLKQFELYTSMQEVDAKFNVDSLLAAMKQDKKVRDGKLTFILSKGIGKAFIKTNVCEKQVKEFLTKELA